MPKSRGCGCWTTCCSRHRGIRYFGGGVVFEKIQGLLNSVQSVDVQVKKTDADLEARYIRKIRVVDPGGGGKSKDQFPGSSP